MSTHFHLLLSITDLYAKLTFELRVKGNFEIFLHAIYPYLFQAENLSVFHLFLDNYVLSKLPVQSTL